MIDTVVTNRLAVTRDSQSIFRKSLILYLAMDLSTCIYFIIKS